MTTLGHFWHIKQSGEVSGTLDFFLRFFDENFDFPPILVKLGSAYVSQDSKKTEKKYSLKKPFMNLNPPVHKGLKPPHPTPGPVRFFIESPNQTSYLVSLVSVSESGSQKFLLLNLYILEVLWLHSSSQSSALPKHSKTMIIKSISLFFFCWLFSNWGHLQGAFYQLDFYLHRGFFRGFHSGYPD